MLRRVLFVLSWFAPAAAGALSVRAMRPEEVARAAEAVVVADVVLDGVEETPEGATVERLVLRVRETWKGEARSTRTLRQWVEHRGRTVPGLPRLLSGRRYLLFLPPASERPVLPVTVGGAQGVYELVAGPGGCVVPRALEAGPSEAAHDSSSPAMRAGVGVTLSTNPRVSEPSSDPCLRLPALRRLVEAP